MDADGSPSESMAVYGTPCSPCYGTPCSPWQQPMATPGGPLHSVRASPWQDNAVHGVQQRSMAVHGSLLFNK